MVHLAALPLVVDLLISVTTRFREGRQVISLDVRSSRFPFGLCHFRMALTNVSVGVGPEYISR